MLIAKEAPFEKSTPEACNTAFPLKLRAPEGSLEGGEGRDKDMPANYMNKRAGEEGENRDHLVLQ